MPGVVPAHEGTRIAMPPLPQRGGVVSLAVCLALASAQVTCLLVIVVIVLFAILLLILKVTSTGIFG